MKLWLIILSFLILLRIGNLENYSNDNYETLMIVNFVRHGNRTPGKLFNEIKPLFHEMHSKKLTLTGFKQMNLLGKYIRKNYIEGKGISKFNLENITHEFLLISSPSQRSIDSSIAYGLGLFPEKMFKIYDFNFNETNRNAVPPISKNFKYPQHEDYYNIVVENRNKNTLFHAKKCKFGNFKYPKPKDFQHLSPEEKKEIYHFLNPLFPETLKNFDLQKFNDKIARSLYSSMRCVNKHFKKNFVIPRKIENILKRMLTVYNFFVKISNDEASRIMSSTFFDHLIKFFDNKINRIYGDKIKNSQNIFDKIKKIFGFFYNISKDEYRSPISEFLPKIENENYSDLKFVTYSGHDGNLTALIRNFLYDIQILEYFKNFEEYKNLLYVSFASNIDFFLINKKEEYFIKILVNGKEPFDKIRSYVDGEYINYDKNYGIPYYEFKKLILTRIYPNVDNCEFDK